ncbi:MAG: hypothetical protein ABSC55_04765 [Syntrophorhabdales bacterium]|jgi:hypothetical protein
MGEADTGEVLVAAILGDLVEDTEEVLEDILPDSPDIPLVVPYLMDFPEVECTVAAVALVVE